MIVPESLQIIPSHPPRSPIFRTAFEMINIDGKGIHPYSIYNYKLNHTSINNSIIMFTSTATTHTNVFIMGIVNQGKMSLWIDPNKTGNHF